MENIVKLSTALGSRSDIKKQYLVNKPLKLFNKSGHIADVIFRASGDLIINEFGEITNTFYSFDESKRVIEIERNNITESWTIIYMNDRIVTLRNESNEYTVLSKETDLLSIEKYLSVLNNSDSTVHIDNFEIKDKSENYEINEISKKKSINFNFIIISSVIILLILSYFFLFRKNESPIESSIDHKKLVLQVISFLNTGKDDSVFSLYNDTLNYFGKSQVSRSDAALDYRNYVTNVIQAVMLVPDTLSITVTTNPDDSSTSVTGIYKQYFTLRSNMIPYCCNVNYEYRFNKSGKIVFINSSVTKKEIDYNAILGQSGESLYFNSEEEAKYFFSNNLGKLNDSTISIEFREALLNAITKKIGPGFLVTDYRNPTITIPLGKLLIMAINNEIQVLETNAVTLRNNQIIDATITYVNSESYTDSNYSIGYYRVSNDYNAHLYSLPNEATKRDAFLTSNDRVYISKIENGFGYTEFTNYQNQTSRGWIKLSQLTYDGDQEQ